jgi:poly(A) polymerase
MENLASSVEPHIMDITRRLRNAGFETYIVGGAVRDLLLGRAPKDYDLSTSATPEEVRRVFGGRLTKIIGKRFRLAHIHRGNEIIEVSTFRRAPSVSSDGVVTLPDDNEYGTAEEDAWRRDFTVNALFYNPIDREIVDHTGMGITDLENGVVRVVGEPLERFEEDPVRVLRALKLVGQYSFLLETATDAALVESIPLISRCSHSRLTLELEKIIKKPYSHLILEAFRKKGLLAYYLPFLNEHWESPEVEYMLALMRERNKRLLSGKYRDSLSLAIATIALPFVNVAIPEEEDCLLGPWDVRRDAFRELRRLVRSLVAPYNFPRRVLASAVEVIMFQPSILGKRHRKRMMASRRYQHARELMVLQNNVRLGDPSLEEYWPPHGKRSDSSFDRDLKGLDDDRRNRRGGRGRGDKGRGGKDNSKGKQRPRDAEGNGRTG